MSSPTPQIECQPHIATLSAKVETAASDAADVKAMLINSEAKREARLQLLFTKLEELKDDHHRADMIVQRTDDRLKAHEESDDSRFKRLWWVAGAFGSLVAAVLFKVVWG